MKLVFDQFFFQSNAASAQILRQKYCEGEFGEEVVFISTTKSYKNTKFESFKEDALCITDYSGIKSKNISLMYLLLLIYVLKNRKKIDEIISMSSPGFNLFVVAILSIFFPTRFYIQDTFPDGKLFALGLEKLKFLFWPFLYLSYKSINHRITISNSMATYLKSTYFVKCDVVINPSNLSSITRVNTEGCKTFFLSGNFSHAHGYELPVMVLKLLFDEGYKLDLNGFGRNFEKLRSSGLFPTDVFGDFMSQEEYERKLATSTVFIILQDYGYERFCATSKFTSLFAIPGSKFLYIGPPCDISETLRKTDRGVHVSRSDSQREIVEKIENLLDESD